MVYKIILASSSPRRKELLETVGIRFEIINPSADETMIADETAEDFALRVSVEKASSVSRRMDGQCVVIGADTVVVVDGEILGKPSDEDEAATMLNKISGRGHRVLTAFSIVKPPGEVLHSEIVATKVRIKPLAAHEIEGYIKTGEPMDKAGAYGIQGIGSFMVREIEGSYTNVVGLPLVELLQALGNLGIVELFSADGCQK
jgi:septum formation protein